MSNLAGFLVLFGAMTLALSLFPVNHLRRRLPTGPCRMAWMFLSVLIVCFLSGYLIYAFMFWGAASHWADLVVPAIFFLGAVFVLVVCFLSAKTADDVVRLCFLEHENVTDPLMGIYNRRHMDRCLQEETSKARRYGLDLSIMLIDVDHFKQVNDTYGHRVGDRVLKELAQLVKGSIRDFDQVFRYGGEELLVLLPYTNSRGAEVLAERLRGWVEDRCLVTAKQDKKRVDIRTTVSIGVSSLCPEWEDESWMIERADVALYQAKEKGRNRVEVTLPGTSDGQCAHGGQGCPRNTIDPVTVMS